MKNKKAIASLLPSLLLISLQLIIPLHVMAQKEFTLEELNFGGKNYRKMVPEYRHYKWKGEMPVRADKHEEPQTNEPQIVKEDDCQLYLVDTDGSRHQLTTDGSRQTSKR